MVELHDVRIYGEDDERKDELYVDSLIEFLTLAFLPVLKPKVD